MSLLKSLIFVFFLYTINSFSQEELIQTTELKPESNIYRHALKTFFNNIESSVEEYKDKESITFKEVDAFFRNLYILKSDFTSSSLGNNLSKRIIFIDNENQLEDIVNINGRQKLLKVIPLRKDEESFFVNIILFQCDFYEGQLQLSNYTGTSIRYSYDCQTNSFAYLEVK